MCNPCPSQTECGRADGVAALAGKRHRSSPVAFWCRYGSAACVPLLTPFSGTSTSSHSHHRCCISLDCLFPWHLGLFLLPLSVSRQWGADQQFGDDRGSRFLQFGDGRATWGNHYLDAEREGHKFVLDVPHLPRFRPSRYCRNVVFILDNVMCSSSPLPGHWSNLRCTTSVWSIVAYIFHHFLFNLSTRFSAVCEGQLEQLLIDIMVWHWHYDMSFDYFCLWSISRCSPSYLHICFPLLTIYSGIIDATLILLPELHVCSFFSQVYFAEHSSARSQGYSRCH